MDDLDKLGWINKSKPLWWQLDYKPDPREKISLDEFVSKFQYLDFKNNDDEIFKVALYCGDKVPIVLHDVEINNIPLTLFLSARPYNKRELTTGFDGSDVMNFARGFIGKMPNSIDFVWPLENFQEYVDVINQFPLKAHYYPHVHGILKEKRGNNFFWYPYEGEEAMEKIEESVEKINANIMCGLYSYSNFSSSVEGNWFKKVGVEAISQESPFHLSPFEELKHKRVINARKMISIDFSNLVSYDDFVKYYDSDTALVSVYPIRHKDLDETIPLVISNVSSYGTRPIVLGVPSEKSNDEIYKFWRFRDENFCQEVSKIISDDLGVGFGTLLFKEGRYRKI